MTHTSETAAELIEALLDQGEAVDAGSFTLDLHAASTKLEAFKYADRNAYLIPMFEALLGLGARVIRVSTKGRDLSISAEGVTLEQALAGLATLHRPLLGRGESERELLLARLSVGLDMALGVEGLARVLFSYNDAEIMHIAEHRSGVEPRLARAPAQVTGELQILLDYAGLSLLGARNTELEFLRPAVAFSPVEITVDGELISQEPREWAEELEGEGDGFRYEAGLTRPSFARIELWTHGVRAHSMPAPHDDFAAILHIQRPRRDLSQLKVLHDEVVEAGLEALAEVRLQLLERREQYAAKQAEREREREREAREREAREQAQQLADEEQREQAMREQIQRLRQSRFGIFTGYLLAILLAAAGILVVQRGHAHGILLTIIALPGIVMSAHYTNLVTLEDSGSIIHFLLIAAAGVVVFCALFNMVWTPFF